MKYKAVLFDLDGTLLDTLADLADSMNAALAESGFGPHPVEAYKTFVGDGIEMLARRVLPHDRCDDETIARCLVAMRGQYAKRWAHKTRPYDGIAQMLDRLASSGVRMAILSNKPDDMAKLTVSELLGRWRFEVVQGLCDGVPRKPDPAGALQIARHMAVGPGEFLYLGDTDTDMITANAAGMYAVGALWGFRSAKELNECGAKKLIARPVELLELLS